MKNAGATVATVLIDYEEHYTHSSYGLFQCDQNWPFTRRCDQVDAELRALQSHPTFTTEVLAPLQARGFVFLNDSLKDSLNRASPLQNRELWDHMIRNRIAAQLNRAIRDPILQVFPQAKISNYGFSPMSDEFSSPDIGGWHWYRNGSLSEFGTSGAFNMYGRMSSYVWLTYPYSDYLAPTPFHAFLMTQSDMRISQNSSPRPLTPWISDRIFPGTMTSPSDGYPQPLLYYENILHALTSGVSHFALWNPDASSSDAGERALNQVLREFDAIIGGAELATLNQNIINLHAQELLSVAYANRYIYRFTPEDMNPMAHVVETPGQVVINLGGRRLTFREGSVLRVPNSIATAGVWIVSPVPYTE
jgi:hypothetical protein